MALSTRHFSSNRVILSRCQEPIPRQQAKCLYASLSTKREYTMSENVLPQIKSLQFIHSTPYERDGRVEYVDVSPFYPADAVFASATVVERDIRGWGLYDLIVRVESPEGFSGYALAELRETE